VFSQVGSLDATTKVNVGCPVIEFEGFGMKPESTPAAECAQGAVKVDCVTV
jgi:hypothetical protein